MPAVPARHLGHRQASLLTLSLFLSKLPCSPALLLPGVCFGDHCTPVTSGCASSRSPQTLPGGLWPGAPASSRPCPVCWHALSEGNHCLSKDTEPGAGGRSCVHPGGGSPSEAAPQWLLVIRRGSSLRASPGSLGAQVGIRAAPSTAKATCSAASSPSSSEGSSLSAVPPFPTRTVLTLGQQQTLGRGRGAGVLHLGPHGQQEGCTCSPLSLAGTSRAGLPPPSLGAPPLSLLPGQGTASRGPQPHLREPGPQL